MNHIIAQLTYLDQTKIPLIFAFFEVFLKPLVNFRFTGLKDRTYNCDKVSRRSRKLPV